ncbi:Tumor suppressor candidate [Entamoeba marina]
MDTKVTSIFFCLFDDRKGPVVMYQDPPDSIREDVFSEVSDFVIPKASFCNRLVKISANDLTFVGYPTMIKHPKYGRNALLFNLCFVFSRETTDATISCFEPLIKQLNKELRLLEINDEYLLLEEKRSNLQSIIPHIRSCLNVYGFCNIDFGDNIQVRVRLALDPTTPIDEIRLADVPVRVNELSTGEEDLGILQIFPYVNGNRTAQEIIELSNASSVVVVEVLKQLVYGNYVVMIPRISDERRFICTDKVLELYENKRMIQACIEFTKKHSMMKTTWTVVFKGLIDIQPKVTWGEFKQTHSHLDVDLNKLLTFGLVNKIIRASTLPEESLEAMQTHSIIRVDE